MPDIYADKNPKGKVLSSKVVKKVDSAKSSAANKFNQPEKEITKIPESGVHNMPGHTHNPLASYNLYPDKIKFVNEDPEEKVVLLLRRHPITNLGWVTFSFVMIILPAFISVFPFFDGFPSQYQLIAFSIWYLLVTAFILEKFLSWFFNVNIVTDERIIDVDFPNLINREISDANIDQIQDVTVEVSGGFRTYFGFGDVLIQTASQIPKVEFESVPNPDKVAKVLRELRIEEEVEQLEGRIR